MLTMRVRKIPYRHPESDEVTKRIDLFKLEEHLARSMERTEVTPMLVVPFDDDFETSPTVPRAPSYPPRAMRAVYPVKRRDPIELVPILIVLIALCAIVSMGMY